MLADRMRLALNKLRPLTLTPVTVSGQLPRVSLGARKYRLQLGAAGLLGNDTLDGYVRGYNAPLCAQTRAAGHADGSQAGTDLRSIIDAVRATSML
jgi:hypothetical protein